MMTWLFAAWTVYAIAELLGIFRLAGRSQNALVKMMNSAVAYKRKEEENPDPSTRSREDAAVLLSRLASVEGNHTDLLATQMKIYGRIGRAILVTLGFALFVLGRAAYLLFTEGLPWFST